MSKSIMRWSTRKNEPGIYYLELTRCLWAKIEEQTNESGTCFVVYVCGRPESFDVRELDYAKHLAEGILSKERDLVDEIKVYLPSGPIVLYLPIDMKVKDFDILQTVIDAHKKVRISIIENEERLMVAIFPKGRGTTDTKAI